MIEVNGTVDGRTIHLQSDPGVAPGQRARITIEPSEPNGAWGEGIRRSAGAAADVDKFDEIFEEVERQRKSAGYRSTEE